MKRIKAKFCYFYYLYLLTLNSHRSVTMWNIRYTIYNIRILDIKYTDNVVYLLMYNFNDTNKKNYNNNNKKN